MNTPKSESSTPTTVLTTAEKQSALEIVLESTTFVRSPQLRNFLRYIGEMEIAGRAGELNEYLIGVEALGREPGYSTTDDSTVRRRAHALRQKLEQVYSTELRDASYRVDLPKGSYVPRFLRWNPDSASPCADTTVTTEDVFVTEKRRRMQFTTSAIILAVLLTAAASGLVFWLLRGRSRVNPALAEAWGPFLKSGPTTICLASPPHYGILPYPEGPLPPGVPKLPVDKDLADWYRQRYPLNASERLETHLTTGPIRLGEVRGLVTVIRTLDHFGVNYDVVPEKDISLPALRGRNLLLFGNPEFSFAASAFLEKAAFTVAYDPGSRERIIRERKPGLASGKVYVPTRHWQHMLAEVFGLITVLPSEGSGAFRTVIFSCTNSAGCEAAAEFFSSANKMGEFEKRVRNEGYSHLPAAYQVVIRSKVHESQAITGDYESHIVLTKS